MNEREREREIVAIPEQNINNINSMFYKAVADHDDPGAALGVTFNFDFHRCLGCG